MYVIRPIALQDLEDLTEIAFGAAPGMTSLPKDKELLRAKITNSPESYLFGLENTTEGRVQGCCGIYAKTGMNEPCYFFQIRTLKTESKQIKIKDPIKILEPIKMQNGPTELCGLYLLPELRKEGLGQLLSLCRLLFIADHRERFDNAIMARLRGYITKGKNTSPFWDGIWSHFVETDFINTLHLLERTQDFIPEILPHYPIYVPLLPKSAQLAIDRTHTSTRPALKMLNKQGLKQSGLVDLFDAGPVVMGKMDEIKTIQKSEVASLQKVTEEPLMSGLYIVSNRRLDYRACYARLKKQKGSVTLERQTADALNVVPGDQVRFIKL